MIAESSFEEHHIPSSLNATFIFILLIASHFQQTSIIFAWFDCSLLVHKYKVQVHFNKTNLTFYPNCERKMIFITISNFWELFVIESIPKCSTSFLIHREIQSGLCYWLNIVHCKTNVVLIVQWTMRLVFFLPWKGKTKLLQKWILCQDNQIKSNHNRM